MSVGPGGRDPEDDDQASGAGGSPPGGPPPGYGPPPPPRPGIVALRPLELDDVLGGAFRYVRSHPAAVLLPAAVVALLTGVVQVVTQASVTPAPGVFPGFVELFTDSLLVSIPVAVVGYAVYPPMLAVQLSVLVPALVGRRLSLGQAWSAARPRIGATYRVYLVFVVLGIVVIGVGVGLAVLIGQAGSVLVAVLVVVAAYAVWIYVAVMLWPAVAVTVVEGLGVRAALERSRSLVRGAWWRFFGYQLVAVVIGMAAAVVIVVPASIAAGVVAATSADTFVATGQLPVAYYVIIAVAVVVLVTPLIGFMMGTSALLYVDQRIRRERYDLELAAQVSG